MTDIAIFIMDLRGGGAERVMLNLTNGFTEKGLTVDLVLVQTVGVYLSQVPSNVRIVDLKGQRLLTSLPALVKYLRQEQPKVLMSALEDTNMVAILAKHLSGVAVQVVVTVHNHLSAEIHNATQWKRRFVPHLIRWFYPRADAVVGVSHGVVQDLQRFGSPSAKTHTIYNPIVTTELLNKIQEPLDHAWFKPDQPPVILAVGRLDRQKDFITLIKSFAQVRQQQPARLIILGEGAERSNLEALIAQFGLLDDVSLPGFVSNPYAYMAHARLLVLSSAWEGFGNVLVEAMAAGTPVVSTDCESGPSEILENGQYGKLVKVGDVAGMTEAIINTLHEQTKIQVLQQRANEFSLEVALLKYQQLLNI